MWILNTKVPSTTKRTDLDGDGKCNYLARVYSEEKSRPPTAATWWANCESGFQDVALSMAPLFQKASGGSCEASEHEPISTTQDCAAAASSLSLHGMSYTASQIKSVDWGPRGCYWNSSAPQLMLASGTAQDEDTGGLALLCKHPGRDTAALLSSAAGYSWCTALLPSMLVCLFGLPWASRVVDA